MAATNALGLWPITFAAASYDLVVTAAAAQETLTMSVTADRFYWLSGDDQADSVGSPDVGGVGDLLTVLEGVLESHGSISSATCTLDANWKLNIVVDAANTTLEWSAGATTLDATVFGFNDGVDSGTGLSITSPNVPKGIWRPQRPMWMGRGDRPNYVAGTSVSLSGVQRTTRLTSSRDVRDVSFRYLTDAVTETDSAASTAPYATLEYAWRNSWGAGEPMRLYADEDTRTSSSYGLYKFRDAADPASPMTDRDLLWWQADMRLIRVTAD